MNMTPDAAALDFGNIDFYPKYKMHRPDKDGPAKFGIHHASITMKIRSTLFARLDFHQFPFDKQTLGECCFVALFPLGDFLLLKNPLLTAFSSSDLTEFLPYVQN